jgi:hypothetical protein
MPKLQWSKELEQKILANDDDVFLNAVESLSLGLCMPGQ